MDFSLWVNIVLSEFYNELCRINNNKYYVNKMYDKLSSICARCLLSYETNLELESKFKEDIMYNKAILLKSFKKYNKMYG